MFKKTAFIITIASLFLGLSNSYSSQTMASLESLEWKNRIILIRESVDCKNTIAHLKQAKTEIDERHIFWFILCKQNQLISNFDGEISSSFLNTVNKKYFSKPKNNVVLIGKDGGVKYRSPELRLNEINTLIDSMPMRQAEMHKAEN